MTNYQYPTVKETDANNCIPALNTTKTYELPTTASNVPNSNYVWNITSTLNDRNNAYRLTQIAQGQTGISTILYIRVASSTNQGASYTFGDWQKLTTESDLNNALANYPEIVMSLYGNTQAEVDLTSLGNGVYFVSANNLYANFKNVTTGILIKYNTNLIYQTITSENTYNLTVDGNNLKANAGYIYGLKIIKIGYN